MCGILLAVQLITIKINASVLIQRNTELAGSKCWLFIGSTVCFTGFPTLKGQRSTKTASPLGKHG